MALIELPHLAIGSPAGVTGAGFPQVRLGELVESARPVEGGSALIGDRLVVHEAVGAGRVDGLLVQPLGVELAAVEAGDLGADQRGAVGEVLRAVASPLLELAVVAGQGLEMPRPLRGRGRVAECGPRQRGVELVFRRLEQLRWAPPQPSRPRRGVEGCGIVAGEEARLELADPVPALGQRQRRIGRQVPFEPPLVELPVVERTESRGQAAQHPDQPELRGDDVNDEGEPRRLREPEAVLGFALGVGQRVARRKEVHVQARAAEGGERDVAAAVRGIEGAAQDVTTAAEMPGPGHDQVTVVQVGPRLGVLQAAPFDQFHAEIAESPSGLMVAEARAGDGAEHDVGDARGVAVAPHEAQLHGLEHDQHAQVPIREERRRHERRQHVQRRQRERVAHHRQVEQRLDWPAPELGPDLLVCAPHVLVGWMRRPVHA